MKHLLKKRFWICTSITIFVFEMIFSTAAFAVGEIANFETARQLAFNGQRAKAKEMCREILKKDNTDSEARTLLGRMHAWDNEYDLARVELNKVLKQNPKNQDARSALVDVELWADKPQAAVDQANEGLKYQATNDELLLKKARALRNMGKADEAGVIAQKAYDVNPRNNDAKSFLTDLSKSQALYNFSASYSQDAFDSTFDDWKALSVSLSRKFGFGSLVGRINQANRFGSDGSQFEIDAYPSIRDGTYAYLNAGYSGDSIFPKYRFGAEIYQGLGGGWEASLGTRHLSFENSVVNIYTASLGKYIGNYYLLLRGNTVPDTLGDSGSLSLQVRRYFGDESYVALSGGTGRSATQLGTSDRVFVLSSARGSLDMHFGLASNWALNAGLGYEDEEVRNNVSRIKRSFSLGIEKRF